MFWLRDRVCGAAVGGGVLVEEQSVDQQGVKRRHH